MQDDYGNETKDTEISAYNSAMLENQRLHNLWVECNHYSRSGQLLKWHWTLDRVLVELSGKAARKDKEKYFKDNKEFETKCRNCRKDRNKFYNELKEREIYLRILQDDVGMGMKWKDSDDDDMRD